MHNISTIVYIQYPHHHNQQHRAIRKPQQPHTLTQSDRAMPKIDFHVSIEWGGVRFSVGFYFRSFSLFMECFETGNEHSFRRMLSACELEMKQFHINDLLLGFKMQW